MGIPRVLPLDNLRKPIDCGYFPNMTTATSSYTIPSRQDKAFLQDLHRDSDYVNLKVADLERWFNRFHEAIDNGYCLDVCIFLLLLLKICFIDKIESKFMIFKAQ